MSAKGEAGKSNGYQQKRRYRKLKKQCNANKNTAKRRKRQRYEKK